MERSERFDKLLKDLNEGFEKMGYEFLLMSQHMIRYYLETHSHNFPMVCYEYTPDSPYEVEISESIFLNDSSHDYKWIVGLDSAEEPVFVMCLKDIEKSDELEIDVLEVSKEHRNKGVAGNILELVERCASKNYKRTCITPFDTSAMNFWKHNGYEAVDEYIGYYKKNIEYEYTWLG